MHRHRSSGVPLVLTLTCKDPELALVQLQMIPSLENDLRFPATRKLRGLWSERAKKSFMMLTTQQSCPGTWPKKVCISEQPRLYFIVFLCRCTVESMMPMAYPWPFTIIWRQSVASLKCYRFDPSFPFPRCGPICVSSRRRAERAPCASLRIAGKMQDGLWWIMMDHDGSPT